MENKSPLILILGLITIIVFAFAGCTVKNNQSDNDAMVKMVIMGADPIAAKCAVKMTSSDGACAVYASKIQTKTTEPWELNYEH